MGFVQIIEFRSSNIDEMRRLQDEWGERAAGESKARQLVLCEDRDTPGRYFNIVFFDSYEEAMENSELPATHEFAQKLAQLTDGEPTFYNLDVVDQRN